MPDGTKTKYWLASRAIHVGDDLCNFGIRDIYWGMNMFSLSNSNNLEALNVSLGMFPIVTINFNMLEGNHTDGWIIK